SWVPSWPSSSRRTTYGCSTTRTVTRSACTAEVGPASGEQRGVHADAGAVLPERLDLLGAVHLGEHAARERGRVHGPDQLVAAVDRPDEDRPRAVATRLAPPVGARLQLVGVVATRVAGVPLLFSGRGPLVEVDDVSLEITADDLRGVVVVDAGPGERGV